MHQLCQECNHSVVSDSACSPPGILWAVPDSQTQTFSVLVRLTLQGVVRHTEASQPCALISRYFCCLWSQTEGVPGGPDNITQGARELTPHGTNFGQGA